MVDVIEDIKENVEEGTKDIEEIAEEEGKIAEKNIKKAKKIGKEAIEEIGKGVKKEGEAIEMVSKKIAGKAEEDIRKATKEIPRGGKFLVEKLGENIEKGAHKVKKEVKKIGGVFKRDGEEIKEIPGEGESILKKLEKSIEKGAEKIEESVEEDLKKVKGAIKREVGDIKKAAEKDVKKVGEFLKEKAQKIKREEKTRIISIEEEAESESSGEKNRELEEKKKALLEKARKLREKISAGEISTEELKEKIKAKKRTDMLVPLEEYVKAGIYLGTRVVTPNMRPFVYRRRADGLAIFNTDTIDEKLKEGIEFLARFPPEDVILICKRQAGWKAAEKFSELTGIKAFTKKYPAGILTNKQLPDFFENELTIITDQWVDKNALNDTLKVRKKVLMVCDTNNFSQGADQIIIGNNKSPKSIGLIFYILARGYCKARGLPTGKIPDLEWWTGEEEETAKKVSLTESGAEFGV